MSRSKGKNQHVRPRDGKKDSPKQASRERDSRRTGREEAARKALAGVRGLVPINREKWKSRSVMPSSPVPHPAGLYYQDWDFTCKDCGKKETWTASQQKWWHEVAGGEVEQIAVRCRACRMKERRRRDEARKVHLEGLAAKKKLAVKKAAKERGR